MIWRGKTVRISLRICK